jgi:hypothetical protein
MRAMKAIYKALLLISHKNYYVIEVRPTAQRQRYDSENVPVALIEKLCQYMFTDGYPAH